MNYLLNPKVRLALIVILLAAVILSFLWDPGNMGQNLIAELAGVALAVWLTVWFVESLLERRHRDRWQAVRTQVLGAILSDVMDIAWAYAPRVYHVIMRSNLLRGSEPPRDAADDLRAMLEEMRKKGPGWWVQELFRDTEWRFHHLRDALSPRLMDVGEEQKLIELLTGIDSLHTGWKGHLGTLERDIAQLGLPFDQSSVESLSTLGEVGWEAQMSLKDSFEAALNTLEALIEVYEHLS